MDPILVKRRDFRTVNLIGVVVGVAALFAMKRGARPDAGSRGGRACCPWMSGVNLLATNPWVAVEATNGKPGVTASEPITNRQR
jgi:hypothetical protein